jgi:cysteinyl-tRNA synthetase
VRLFDTATRSLVEVSPPPALVGMYVCGPTVYARTHLGNARPFVLGMWLRSWLRAGNRVTFVHNITDVNDKIYAAAPGASAALADAATAWYLEDIEALGLGMPDQVPRATQFIPQIVRFIEALIAGGSAYAAGGDVYFRVATARD